MVSRPAVKSRRVYADAKQAWNSRDHGFVSLLSHRPGLGDSPRCATRRRGRCCGRRACRRRRWRSDWRRRWRGRRRAWRGLSSALSRICDSRAPLCLCPWGRAAGGFCAAAERDHLLRSASGIRDRPALSLRDRQRLCGLGRSRDARGDPGHRLKLICGDVCQPSERHRSRSAALRPPKVSIESWRALSGCEQASIPRAIGAEPFPLEVLIHQGSEALADPMVQDAGDHPAAEKPSLHCCGDYSAPGLSIIGVGLFLAYTGISMPRSGTRPARRSIGVHT